MFLIYLYAMDRYLTEQTVYYDDDSKKIKSKWIVDLRTWTKERERIFYYKNWNKEWSWTFYKWKKEWGWMYFHENNSWIPKATWKYVDWKKEWTRYYYRESWLPSGCVNYKNNERDWDCETFYDRPNTTQQKCRYAKWKIYWDLTTYYPGWGIKAECGYIWGVLFGHYKCRFPSWNIQVKWQFSEWEKHWLRRYFYESWCIRWEFNYVHWILEWKVITYYENWNIGSITTYVNWLKEWISEMYSSMHGHLSSKQEFHNWILIKETWYNEDWTVDDRFTK